VVFLPCHASHSVVPIYPHPLYHLAWCSIFPSPCSIRSCNEPIRAPALSSSFLLHIPQKLQYGQRDTERTWTAQCSHVFVLQCPVHTLCSLHVVLIARNAHMSFINALWLDSERRWLGRYCVCLLSMATIRRVTIRYDSCVFGKALPLRFCAPPGMLMLGLGVQVLSRPDTTLDTVCGVSYSDHDQFQRATSQYERLVLVSNGKVLHHLHE